MSSVALLLALTTAALAPAPAPDTPAPVRGYSYQYKPGVFAQVLRVRGMRTLPGVSGFASTPDCRKVDVARPWTVLVRWADGSTDRLQVADCSNPTHLAAQRRRGLVLEVDFKTAVRGGWATYGGYDGPGHAPVTILRYWH